jgi:hypothetical protein
MKALFGSIIPSCVQRRMVDTARCISTGTALLDCSLGSLSDIITIRDVKNSKVLTDEEKELLSRWLRLGAEEIPVWEADVADAAKKSVHVKRETFLAG